MSVEISPILDEDLEEVGEFLHLHMNSQISAEDWTRSFRVPWRRDWPNHGFQIRDEARLVGVYTAIYSERPIRGASERFCNLAAWTVLPDYRFHSLMLLKKLTSQRGYHFTDLSPNAETVKIGRRFKFQDLDPTWILMPNLPTLFPGASIIADEETIASRLDGQARRIFEDHRGVGTLRHILVTDEQRVCHLIFQADSRKGIPCATILYVGEPEVLARHYRALGAHLLLREAALFTIFEANSLSRPPRLALRRESRHHKLYRSESLAPTDVDNLYSELVALTWPTARRRVRR